MEGRRDELAGAPLCIARADRLAPDEVRHRFAVRRVEGLIDLVEQVEGRRVAALDREDQREGNEGLLPSAQLLHLELLPSPREVHEHADAAELADPHRGGAWRHLRLHVAVVIRRGREPTHDLQLAGAVRDELFEDVGEVLANVRERSVDRFVFALVERLNEFLFGRRARARERERYGGRETARERKRRGSAESKTLVAQSAAPRVVDTDLDRLRTGVQLLLALLELLLLRVEVLELPERLLVDVAELLQLLVPILERLQQRLALRLPEVGELFAGEVRALADLTRRVLVLLLFEANLGDKLCARACERERERGGGR